MRASCELPSGPGDRRSETGAALVEILISFVFLAIGLLGYVQTVASAQMLARSTRELNLADALVVDVVEAFHDECTADFSAAVAGHRDGSAVVDAPVALGAGARLVVTPILDERLIVPRMDLNGDGDYRDGDLQPHEVRAAVLRVELSWQTPEGTRRVEHTAVVARGER